MDTPLHTGSCLCGAVHYEVRGALGPAYCCHCSLCRKQSGSAFSVNAAVAFADFTVTQGQGLLKAWTNDNGVSRWFCAACGSPIYVSQGDQMRLRLGGLDTPLATPPQMHIYTGSKAEWFTICDGLPQHAQRPEPHTAEPPAVPAPSPQPASAPAPTLAAGRSTLPPSPVPELRTLELTAAQAPLLQAFFNANPDYFVIVHGEPAHRHEALEEINSKPPKDFSFSRKWVVGYQDRDGRLAAMATVLTDLLAPGICHIGLFMVATHLYGTGIAHALYQGLEDWAVAHDSTWMRLGVVQGNVRAERFWQSLGYVPLRTRDNVEMGILTNTVVTLAKPLTGQSLAQYLEQVPRDRAD